MNLESRNKENLFFGPDGLRPGWGVALYIVLFLFLLISLETLELIAQIPLLRASDLTPGIFFLQEVLEATAALVAALVMARVEARSFRDYAMPWSRTLQRDFWFGALWGIAGISLLMLAISAFGGYSIVAFAMHGVDVIRYTAFYAVAFVVVGITEEFLFRGYVQVTLTHGIGFWPAALITSAAFGATHLANPGEAKIGALAVFAIGLFLCLTLRRTGSLWFAIGWHAAWDFGETFLYSVPNSGIVMRGSLLMSRFHGPAWLTGGSVGPEGSALDFVLIALMTLAFDRVYRPTSQNKG